MSGQVTIPIQDWENQKKHRETLEQENARLRTELEEARLGDTKDDRRRLAAALSEALTIVSFTIAERNPMAFRGFPYKNLRTLKDLLPDCPGIPETYREVAVGDWELVAVVAERWETARAEGREQEELAEENAMRAPSLERFKELMNSSD